MSDQQFTPYEIDDETFKKMQAKMLEMLLYFKDFCGKHNLMFYLCGGGRNRRNKRKRICSVG